jgi:hypothetical protein
MSGGKSQLIEKGPRPDDDGRFQLRKSNCAILSAKNATRLSQVIKQPRRKRVQQGLPCGLCLMPELSMPAKGRTAMNRILLALGALGLSDLLIPGEPEVRLKGLEAAYAVQLERFSLNADLDPIGQVA